MTGLEGKFGAEKGDIVVLEDARGRHVSGYVTRSDSWHVILSQSRDSLTAPIGRAGFMDAVYIPLLSQVAVFLHLHRFGEILDKATYRLREFNSYRIAVHSSDASLKQVT